MPQQLAELPPSRERLKTSVAKGNNNAVQTRRGTILLAIAQIIAWSDEMFNQHAARVEQTGLDKTFKKVII